MSDEALDDILDDLVPDPPGGGQPPRVEPKAPAPAGGLHRALEMAGVVVVSVALAVGGTAWWLGGRRPEPVPTPSDFDPAFVAIGRAHAGRLGQEYGDAWDDGAKLLDTGQPVGMGLDTVARAWEANRKAGFNAHVTPEFSKVLPQSKNEKEVTAAERTALARAWRGFARGLRGK